MSGIQRFVPRRHPSRDALLAWLAGEDDHHSDLDNHLATCNRCATTLEELESPSGNGNHVVAALAAVYRAPIDLSERLERRVVDRLDSQVILDVMTELFGAGLETGRLLLTEEAPDE